MTFKEAFRVGINKSYSFFFLLSGKKVFTGSGSFFKCHPKQIQKEGIFSHKYSDSNTKIMQGGS